MHVTPTLVINCIVWVPCTVTEFYKMRECLRTLIFLMFLLFWDYVKFIKNAKWSSTEVTVMPSCQRSSWHSIKFEVFFKARQSLKTHKSLMQVTDKYACTHTPACMLIHPSTHTHTYLVQKQHQLLVGGWGKNCWLQFLTATAQWVSGIQHFQYNIRCINNLQPIHFQSQK